MTANSPFTFDGMSMSVYEYTGYASTNYQNELRNELATGFNYVELSNQAVIDLSTGAISNMPVNAQSQTASQANVIAGIQAAEAAGEKVFLKPQINAYDPWEAQWGSPYANLTNPNLVITNPAAFFAGYEAYIVGWAKIAQQYNVPLFSIGNEMIAATKPEYTSYWNSIIAAVRQVYSGQLTYSAMVSADLSYTAQNEVSQIGFWGKLDYVGVDVYTTLPGISNPTVAQLNAAWQHEIGGNAPYSWTGFLNNLASSTGKQIIFTESGVASFSGATDKSATSNSDIGKAGTQNNPQLQANWYESFFQTWSGANKPSWLAGVFFWNNDPNDTGLYYANNYDIYGKPANSIVASYLGGGNYLTSNQSAYAGTTNHDSIFLYGDLGPTLIAAGNSSAITRPQTFLTTVTIWLDGTIMNGIAPTVHFYINGADLGAQALSTTAGTYIDNKGVSWDYSSPFSFNVSGLTAINQIKVVVDSPTISVNGENSQVYINSANINGVTLSSGVYQPSSGSASNFTSNNGGLGGLYNGGYLTIDPAPYNATLVNQLGTNATPISVNGGGGTDTVYALGNATQYSLTPGISGAWNLNENAGLNQNATLTAIAQVDFQDGSQIPLMTTLTGYAHGVMHLSESTSNYTITIGTNGTSIVDKLHTDLANTLVNIQRLQFTDTNIALDIGPTQTAGSVYMLYQATFNRTPDAAGLGYWIAQVDKGANIITNVAASFIQSPEFVSKYGSNPSNASYVDNLYQNVLHRAGESGGVAYWNQQLNSGAATKAFVLEQFATLAEGAALVAPTIAHGIAYQQWVG